MSGNGESEKWWKRLLGWRRTLPERVGDDEFVVGGAVAISGDSSIEDCS